MKKKEFLISNDLKKIINNKFPDKDDSSYVNAKLHELYDYYAAFEDFIGVRIFAAVLKTSGNSIEKFEQTIDLAKSDWRDVLVNAGFGNDIKKHEKWIKENC